MSLWTPDGEHAVPPRTQSAGPAPSGGITPEIREALAEAGIDVDQLSPEQLEQAMAMLGEMAAVRQQLLAAPAASVIANHVMGMYELAAIHLGENPPNFGEAHLAIEAMRAVIERLGDAFGEDGAVLRQGLSQLQMTFVQLKDQVTSEP